MWDEFVEYVGDGLGRGLEKEISWFFEETGGLPLAASLLKASLSKMESIEGAREIFRHDVASIQSFLLSNVISKLNEFEREFVEAASVFEYVFSIEEANLILDKPIKSSSIIKSLAYTGIVIELENGVLVHDSIRPACYAMLLQDVSTGYHRKLAIHYQKQMEVSGHLFEIINKWGSHVDRVDDLKSEYMKKVSSLSLEKLFCLWAVSYSGFPYCFSESEIKKNFIYATELLQENLIEFDVNYDKESKVFNIDRAPNLLAVNTDDPWDESFIWFLGQRDTPANHMGYIDVTRPNFAWSLQRHTMCPWEHCIEYEPLAPYGGDALAVRTWFEQALSKGEFAWRGQSTNANTLARLDELVGLGDSKASDVQLGEIVGSCPVFGHCCPGGPEQSAICRRGEEGVETIAGDALPNLDLDTGSSPI